MDVPRAALEAEDVAGLGDGGQNVDGTVVCTGAQVQWAFRTVGQRYRIVYRVERREVTVLIVAVGRRRSGDKNDVYELARKLLRQRRLR